MARALVPSQMTETEMEKQTFTAGPVMVGNLRYGSLRYLDGKGWHFTPNVFGRLASRKWHETAEAALPRWVCKAIRKADALTKAAQ